MNLAAVFTLRKFITPMLATIIYWIGLFVIGVAAFTNFGIMRLLRGPYYQYGDTSTTLSDILVAVIVAVVGALVWRVWCELWVVVFSINDRLGKLVEMNGGTRR